MKLYKVFFIFILLQVSTIAASKLSLKYDNFEQAANAQNRIIFNMSSTKAGLITTDFQGVVKGAKITYTKDGMGSYKDISIQIDAKKLDTDNESRNEKMYEKCLEVEKNPHINVHIPGPIRLGELNKGTIEVRNKKHSIDIFIERLASADGQMSLVGKAVLSLKKLEIPDPSIWIATVHDEIEVNFYLIP
ncbi:YceI family protein [Halobacteriovorax sp. RT-2-4]|uniref:YceI family protein n=1 Tax=unclassified Halobacteriovorax TaxID=2639665 RepID=UPI00399AAF4A